jgi:hypothetical protein
VVLHKGSRSEVAAISKPGAAHSWIEPVETMKAKHDSTTHFLNVDVDLRLSGGIDELLAFFEPSVIVLNRTAQERGRIVDRECPV